MPDIFERINELTEKFSNLFEVDDLGQPAMDVPPSQNKIKKDRKTKDGKVELVSVEDELFPYDGNKREQYRQKILDTINNMIQGTATLEDLLQITRQKKAPLKEAMELVEDLYSYIKKRHGEPKYKGSASEPDNASAKLIYKSDEAKGKEYDQEKEKNPDVNLYNKRFQTKNTKGEKETELRSRNYRKFTDDWKLPKTDDEKIEGSIARHEKKEQKKAPLKEAMELMEDIRTAIEKKHGKPEYYSGRSPWQVGREPANKSAKLTQKANEIKEKEALQAAERELDKDRPDLKDAHPAKKNYKITDYYGQIMARRNGKAPLKEAMEILESLEATVEKKYGKLFDKNLSARGLSKHRKLINAQSNEIVDAAKRNLPNEEKNSSFAIDKEINKIEARRNNTKNKVGQYMTDLRTVGYGGKLRGLSEIPDNRKADAESGYKVATEKSINRHAKKRAKVLEAIELMEAIINEVSIGKWKEAAKSSLPKRKEEAEKAEATSKQIWKDYEEEVKRSPEDEEALYKRASYDDAANYDDKIKKGSRADHAEAVANLNVSNEKSSANKLLKAASKVSNNREDEFGRNPNARTLKRANRAANLAYNDPITSRSEFNFKSEAFIEEANHHANKKNPVVKITADNLNVASGKSLPGPWREHHIGKYIVYNKDTDASYLVSPDNWKKSKIKRDLEKQGKVYEAIRLMEELLNEKVTVAKWVEAAKKVKDARADKASKELAKNIFGKEDNGDEAHNAVHRQAHAEAVSKLAPSDDNAQDVREIHRAAIEPLRKKVDRAIKAGKSTTEAVKRLEKAQEIAGVRPDSSKYVN